MTSTLGDKAKRPFPWLLGLMTSGILLLGTTSYFVVRNSQSGSQADNLTVVAKTQNLTVQIQGNGTVEPIQSVNISPKNPGRIVELRVEQGDKVKQGQILAIMENDEIKAEEIAAQASLSEALANYQQAQIRLPAEINQAQARLDQAIANLNQAQQRIPRQIEQAQAQLDSAQARFQLAQDRLKRNEYLLSQGAVAKDEFDAALNEYRNAQAVVLEAQQRFYQAQNTQNPEIATQQAAVTELQLALQEKKKTVDLELARLKALADQAQARLEKVKIQYRDTSVTAPFDGIITQRYATAGAFVTPTTSASTSASATSSSILALARGLEVIAEVPEVDVGQLKPGQAVNIVADAYPDRVFQGSIKRIAPEAVVEQNVTSFQVVISLLSGTDLLRSKMNVNVTFLGDEINNAVVVPSVAIVTQNGQPGVMIPNENNKPKFQPVTIGVTLKDQTQILQGLESGEKVFIDLPEDKK